MYVKNNTGELYNNSIRSYCMLPLLAQSLVVDSRKTYSIYCLLQIPDDEMIILRIRKSDHTNDLLHNGTSRGILGTM